jgi:EF-P beta-lysylation protein EpmB
MTSHLSQTKPAATVASREEISWQQEMKQAIRSSGGLCEFLKIPPAAIDVEENDFPVFVPRSFAARMNPGDPADPLLLQVIAQAQESLPIDGYEKDPNGEATAVLAAGVLRKYSSRALMITSGACAVHCRYCFRRHYPYSDSPSGLEQWRQSLEAIAQDTNIEEVILSGGDPLVMSDQSIGQLLSALADISHVKHVRFHTRTPVIIASRITPTLLLYLKSTRLKVWFVIHSNHANELDGEVLTSLAKLQQIGIPVLNQAVLLRRVNDSEDALYGLCKRLIDAQITPYYLHQLDEVAGAAHFYVSPDRGRELIAAIRKRLPGYAVPRYVKEIAGEQSKTVLA